MPTATPIDWNDPSTAVALLAPLIRNDGVENVLVRLDDTNPHYGLGSKYKQARFCLDSNGEACWLQANGLPLHNCVLGWALAG
jgi:hypothetical protein